MYLGLKEMAHEKLRYALLTGVMCASSIMSMASMVMGVTSGVRGKGRLLLSSRIVLPLSILPFAALHLLLFVLNHQGQVYQLLVVSECCHHQLHT